MVGIEPKDTTKPKSRRRKDLSHAASKENTGDLSESTVTPTTSFGEGVNLELQLIKTPGHDKSVLTYKLL